MDLLEISYSVAIGSFTSFDPTQKAKNQLFSVLFFVLSQNRLVSRLFLQESVYFHVFCFFQLERSLFSFF